MSRKYQIINKIMIDIMLYSVKIYKLILSNNPRISIVIKSDKLSFENENYYT